MICWKCQKSDGLPDKPNRLELCPRCNSFLHCCLNCRFYEKNAYHECKEPQAEWVQDKKMANFCGYFFPREGKNDVSKSNNFKKMITKGEAEKRWAEIMRKK
jgi:hypothetical protein